MCRNIKPLNNLELPAMKERDPRRSTAVRKEDLRLAQAIRRQSTRVRRGGP